ncbi:MAG: hypothetical protein ACI3VX_03780 [Faecousia sp.]
MKHRTLTQIIAMLLCALFAISAFPITASADTGPKPSVRIYFENMSDELCYGTLLSKTESTGPASAWNGDAADARHNENEAYSYAVFDYETWKAFAEYEDTDGYSFLQEGWVVSETKKIEWTYYPPDSFKILLYYPQTQSFVVSGIYERYAFDTYYTVDMDGVNIGSVAYDGEQPIEAYRSYPYTQEILSLIARIVITILMEMGIALLFGFRRKKQLLLLIGVNAATQIFLNVLLNGINYNAGPLAFVGFYILLELVVFVLEAIAYRIWMKKLSAQPRKNWVYVLYALVANGVSFGAGMLLARWLPGIF